MKPLFIMLLAITHVSAQKYSPDGAIITKPGYFTLNDPNPMTIRVNKYTECTGIIDICYKSRSTSKDVLQKCPNDFCFLGIDVVSGSSHWGSGVVQGTSMIFKLDDQEACQPEKSNQHTYDVLTLPQNCQIEIIGATEPRTTTKSTAVSTTLKSETTTMVEKSTATMTIVIICGVLAFLFVLLVIGLILFFIIIKPRWVAARARRQPIVDAERGEHQTPLIPAKALSTTVATKTPKATPMKTTTKPKPPSKTTKETDTPAPTSEKKTLQTEHTTTEDQNTVALTPVRRGESRPSDNEDKTQDSPTGTEGTPPVDHKAAQAMRHKSVFRAGHYIPRKHTKVPYRRKKKLDSLEQLVPIAESVLATLERNERVSKTIQMTVATQWRLDVDHVLSKLEKSILRDVSEVALDSLAELILELDNDLIGLHSNYLENDSSPIAWDFVNKPTTPASAGFRLFAMSYPVVLDDIKPNLGDPLISAISVPGLYLLLLSSHFSRDFKAKLLKEMRERARQLFEIVPTNNLANSPFPLPYLSRRHSKDPINFVMGVPKKNQKKK